MLCLKAWLLLCLHLPSALLWSFRARFGNAAGPILVWKPVSVDRQKRRLLETITQTPIFTSWLGLIGHNRSRILFLKVNKRHPPRQPVVNAEWIANYKRRWPCCFASSCCAVKCSLFLMLQLPTCAGVTGFICVVSFFCPSNQTDI